jgi:glycerol-3-phosphate acyltransferase PlsX
LLKKKINGIRSRLDYSKSGGALFLGVNKPVIKAHGSSDRDAIKAAVFQAVSYAGFNISDKITAKLAGEEINLQ